jgi:hypothetical protein
MEVPDGVEEFRTTHELPRGQMIVRVRLWTYKTDKLAMRRFL